MENAFQAATGEPPDLWSAPAKRSGDGALDRPPTAVERRSACVTRPRNPKRGRASLAPCLPKPRRSQAALQSYRRRNRKWPIPQLHE